MTVFKRIQQQYIVIDFIKMTTMPIFSLLYWLPTNPIIMPTNAPTVSPQHYWDVLLVTGGLPKTGVDTRVLHTLKLSLFELQLEIWHLTVLDLRFSS